MYIHTCSQRSFDALKFLLHLLAVGGVGRQRTVLQLSQLFLVLLDFLLDGLSVGPRLAVPALELGLDPIHVHVCVCVCVFVFICVCVCVCRI